MRFYIVAAKVLNGDRVLLRALAEEGIPLLGRWLFDPDILHWLQLSEDPPEHCTEEAVRERYERMQADSFTETWRIDTAEGRPIGQIELVEIHPLQRRAEMHLSIGEKDVWGGVTAHRLSTARWATPSETSDYDGSSPWRTKIMRL